MLGLVIPHNLLQNYNHIVLVKEFHHFKKKNHGIRFLQYPLHTLISAHYSDLIMNPFGLKTAFHDNALVVAAASTV